MASIRQELDGAEIPAGAKGAALVFIAGALPPAFMGFAGMSSSA